MEFALLFSFAFFSIAQSTNPRLNKERTNYEINSAKEYELAEENLKPWIWYKNWKRMERKNIDANKEELDEIKDTHSSLSTPQPEDSVCLTQGCVKAAAFIINNINETVNPCEDFYEFACGGFNENQIIPDDEYYGISSISLLQDDVNRKLRPIVEKDIKESDPPYIQNVKYMYESCKNTTHIEKQGSIPLKKVLNELGGWPVVNGSACIECTYDWMQSVFTLRKQGFSFDILLSLDVRPDERNNTRNTIHLYQPSLVINRTSLLNGLNDKATAAYYKLMVDSAVLLGANRTTAEEELKETLTFEIQLANISGDGTRNERNASRLYNKMTVDDLCKLAPNINWYSYMNNLLSDVIKGNEEVIVASPEFVQRLDKLLAATKKRVVANYVMWRIVLQALPMLGGEMFQNYINTFSGFQKVGWKRCLGKVSGENVLANALASLYVKKHFQEENKLQASEMVGYILKELLKIVDAVDWMDNKTRDRAKAKANSIFSYVGYADELLNSKDMEDMYKNLNLHPYDYFENYQRLNKWSTDRDFFKLRKLNLKRNWQNIVAATIVNALYSPYNNHIIIPAAIIQGEYFGKDRPKYLNFGALGFIIGHEITHGFDDTGRQFDKDGNLSDWWEEDADKNFRERTQCIIDQYGNYTFKELDLNVNGTNTQGENIADNGGVKEAFKAYELWARGNGQEKKLPGLKYTPTQLFWISAAQGFCDKYTSAGLRSRILTDPHTPAPFRVNGLVVNSVEFSKEFSCAKGTPMNPEKKCLVW